MRVATCGLLLRGTQNAARDIHMRACRNPDRKAGLTDTAWPDEADQTGRSQLPSEFRKLRTAADEARRIGRQVARTAGGPGHGEQEVAMAAGRSPAFDYASNRLFDGFPGDPSAVGSGT